jgi:hypothetical protein
MVKDQQAMTASVTHICHCEQAVTNDTGQSAGHHAAQAS